MIVRAALALVAVLVVAWLGIMLRDAHLKNEGIAALFGLSSPAVADQARDRLERARLLSPDTDPDLYRAYIDQAQGRWAPALVISRRITKKEPQNLAAWVALYSSAAHRHERALADRAKATARRLSPNYPPLR